MATQINTRLSDELEEKLNILVEHMKKEAPRGTDVTSSSVVRGGLEKFIEEREFEKEGIVLLPISLKHATDNDLMQLQHIAIGLTVEILRDINRSDNVCKSEKYISEVLGKINREIAIRKKDAEL